MRNNQTVKKAKTHCCPMCGSTEFSAHQVIHVDVMVDIETGFFNGNISGDILQLNPPQAHSVRGGLGGLFNLRVDSVS